MVARGILAKVPTLALVVGISFLLLKLAPGDLAMAMAGDAGAASPEYMEMLRRQYGLDQPMWMQFWHYIANVARLDFGYSFRNSMPVLELIAERVPATLLLVATSIVIALVVGVSLGVWAAYRQGRWIDTGISTLSTIGFALPLFWVGLLLIILFAVDLRWLPTGGIATTGFDGGFWAALLDRLRHLVLPAFTLSLFYIAIYARIVRAAASEVLRSEYVRTARAKGLRPARILWRHVLRNCLLPVVSITGLELGTLLGGVVTIETVFSWPGMGRLAFDAVTYRDMNLLMGILVWSAVLVSAVNLILDALYTLVDPRVELR
ncbi:MAG: Glutathione transport system permease protein GsiC [Xylophilus sp.]|nr:MAG: Glutathione transport system permease protein GsiC [Xylophilus sp.]